MKSYLISTEHIIHTDLADTFISDMVYCENYDIPVYNELEGDGWSENTIKRVDGQRFPSGQADWMHDTQRWPVVRHHHKHNLLPEELFTI